MKVYHVITDLKDGGAEAVLYRLISQVDNHEHRVICLGSGGKYVSMLEDININVDVVNMRSGVSGIFRLLSIVRLINSFKPDVIQSWMYHANFITGIYGYFFKKIPIYWGIHHTNLVKNVDSATTIFVSRCCAILSSKVPKKIICCGFRSKDVHEEYGYSKEKLSVIENGYDSAHFIPDFQSRFDVRRELGFSDEEFIIGVVGRYNPQKDHANLINALKIIELAGIKLKCVLVGANMDIKNAPLLQTIKKSKLKEKPQLLGMRSDIEKLMCALDLHVTSSAFGEAFPNVICEAMSCGTICVTTDVGDAATIVADTGYVVPPSDAKALADAVIAAYFDSKNDDEWADKKNQARQRIKKNFSVQRMSECYITQWII